MKACSERFTQEVIDKMRQEIEEAEGNEVLFVAHQNEEGTIFHVDVPARGTEASVPALLPWLNRGDILIHNHPSGHLKPSAADMGVAVNIGNQGIGFYIIDNLVEGYYAVAEPIIVGSIQKLDKATILNTLEPDGPLSKIFSKYEYRESQVDMIGLIADAFNENKVAVIEAGTGVGKSLAYLLPSIEWAATNKEKVVISTATINLQQQIFEKDLPLAQQVLGKEISAVLVKGRGNYVCMRRLDEALSELSLFEEENEDLEELDQWVENASEGCRTELPFNVDSAVWAKVCSESDNCLGLRCKHREHCFVLKMKKKAAGADILVANHHLLFADLAYRLDEAGFEQAAVLPPFKKVIFDEAHNIEQNATSFFSESMNRFSIFKILSRVVSRQRNRYSGIIVEIKKFDFDGNWVADLPLAVEEVIQVVELLDAYTVALLEKNQSLRLQSGCLTSEQKNIIDFLRQLHSKVGIVHTLLGSIFKALPEEEKEGILASELSVFLSRLEGIATLCALFVSMDEHPYTVFWVKREKTAKGDFFASYTATPLNIASKLQAALFEPFDSVICTSATLSVGNRFDNFFKRCGISLIDQDRVLCNSFLSPFSYKRNVLLQVPSDGPEPDHPRFTEYVQRYIARALEITEGRGLVLFTSYAMLEEVYAYCRPILEKLGITVFKQGEEERSRLLNKFNKDISSVLFATSSFWEGIDSPGETLSIVIITKLPFSVPTDPILKARMDAIATVGGNPFMEISVPDAVMKLKQGFGRLIRSHEDRGIVTILDGRVVRKQYGSIFLNSLPETARSIKEGRFLMEDLERFLY